MVIGYTKVEAGKEVWSLVELMLRQGRRYGNWLY